MADDIREELIEALLTSGEFNVYAKANRRWYAARVADAILASPVIARIRSEATAAALSHIDAALTGSGSPDESVWPGYWEAKRQALAELTAAPTSIHKGSES